MPKRRYLIGFKEDPEHSVYGNPSMGVGDDSWVDCLTMKEAKEKIKEFTDPHWTSVIYEVVPVKEIKV